ncbi:response regulator transcription factor [Microbaculum sp. FT89]|uniref:response regulator transcription factor n=1 Tax=Microbaculum sp. FT89 TaxID=3447298 RepID=UPI003F53CAC7
MRAADRAVTIHVVDDDEKVTSSLVWLLESINIHVVAYNSPRGFLAALSDIQGPFCLVVDLRMPELDGLELQQEIRNRGYDLPVLFLSAHGDVSAAVAAMRQGAFSFMEKPYAPNDLLANINKMIEIADAEFSRRESHREWELRYGNLTCREKEIALMLRDGFTSKEISAQLMISPKTVDAHRINIMRKLDVSTRSDLFATLKTASHG